jgi:hypothetical protein
MSENPLIIPFSLFPISYVPSGTSICGIGDVRLNFDPSYFTSYYCPVLQRRWKKRKSNHRIMSRIRFMKFQYSYKLFCWDVYSVILQYV